jgi:effector-binding domain-containing protein
MLEVEEKQFAPQPAVVIRARARQQDLGPAMDGLFPAILAFVQGSAVELAGPPFCRYLSMGDEEWEFECGVPVTGPLAGEGRVEAAELPGGDVLSTMHVGPYETLGQSWDALDRWVKENGKVPGGAAWEVYWTDPGETSDPAEGRTELVMPLAQEG